MYVAAGQRVPAAVCKLRLVGEKSGECATKQMTVMFIMWLIATFDLTGNRISRNGIEQRQTFVQIGIYNDNAVQSLRDRPIQPSCT